MSFVERFCGKVADGKGRSFDAVTEERFDVMVAISVGLRVNWSNVLFAILTSMVASPSCQSQGYTIQIGNLLETFIGVDLGEFMARHPLKVLNVKSVHTYKMENYSVVSEFVEAKHQIGDEEKIVAKKKPKSHEDSRSNELKKKWIKKRKAIDGGESITMKKPVVEGSRPIKVRSDTSLEAAERPSPAGFIADAHPVDGADGCVGQMVVENIHLEDPSPEVVGDSGVEAQVEVVVAGTTSVVGGSSSGGFLCSLEWWPSQKDY
ncbi:hypothetical protein F511_20578 [Dorcoceras hygrometricum]|uniref:Uncharacterized protein n=1 Tax=Dorcoceras hygrometricum TaxID=472368 RepID=A0A2Z7D310_9LAMI|nr:hypothetical protein F511_20578 [Dorcoceras hygrometricum]